MGVHLLLQKLCERQALGGSSRSGKEGKQGPTPEPLLLLPSPLFHLCRAPHHRSFHPSTSFDPCPSSLPSLCCTWEWRKVWGRHIIHNKENENENENEKACQLVDFVLTGYLALRSRRLAKAKHLRSWRER